MKDHIIQFVGFATHLATEEFITQWEPFARTFAGVRGDMMLHQGADHNTRYRYISCHECHKQDFRFKFMKGRNSLHFPDKKVKVIEIGGYIITETDLRQEETEDVKVIAFIGHDDNDIDFYRLLSYHCLNIYQAYYENCAYSHILEFLVPEADALTFVQQLKKRTGVEAAIYHECLVPHE